MRFCWSDFERRQKSRTDMRCGFIELLKKEKVAGQNMDQEL